MVHSQETNVVRTGVETQLPQPRRIQRHGNVFPRQPSPMRFDRGMLL
jgi:hypothetical protein